VRFLLSVLTILSLSQTIYAEELPAVAWIEKNTQCYTEYPTMCEIDNTEMILHLIYGGCDQGQLELDVELSDLEMTSYGHYVRTVTFLVKNVDSSGCDMSIRSPFKISGKQLREMAEKKAKAIDPQLMLGNGVVYVMKNQMFLIVGNK